MRASTSSTYSGDEYISQHPEAELARLQKMSATQGLGEYLDVEDEELTGLMKDFGMNIERE